VQPLRTESPKQSENKKSLIYQEFRGSSPEEAERVARESLGNRVMGIEIVRNAHTTNSTAQAKTAEEAAREAEARVPAEAIERKPVVVVQEGQAGTVEVQEWDEREARKAARRRAPRGAQLDEIVCVAPPKNGVLGVGKKPGTWSAKWSAPFIAEVEYRMPAVIKAGFFG